MDLTVATNSVAYFTTSPETHTWNSVVYAPVPMQIGAEEQAITGELPRLTVDVWNIDGQVFRYAKDNDLSLNDVTIRLVNTLLPDSGSEAQIRLQILGVGFVGELARFTLGHSTNFDFEGPKATWNRRDFPSIPFNFRSYAII